MVHFLNPLHCLTEKPVSFLLASSSVLSTHTAGFVIKYLSSVALFTDCCYLNNYSDRMVLSSVRTCFSLGIISCNSFCVNLCVWLCHTLLHDEHKAVFAECNL